MQNYPSNIESSLHKLAELCRSLLPQEERPEGRALLETTADVLGGLEQAFHDFTDEKNGFSSSDRGSVSPKSEEPWD